MSKKSTFFSIFFLMFPAIGYSLGFGNLTLFSKLNEPLKIHINLLSSKSVSLDDIIIKNADSNTYRQANIPKPEAFNQVRFKTKKQADGSIIVELTTKKPLREPFFTFIIDMKWRSGHLNREYTFLLDPAEIIYKQAYAKSSKKVTAKKTGITKAPGIKKPRKVPQRKVNYDAVIASHADGDTYGPTKRADTLWSIAKKVKPGNNVTTYQTMQALFALNPDAFINGNIDLLKQGQTLKIPTSNEIRQINGKPPLQPLTKKVPESSVKSTSSSTSKQQKSTQTGKKPSDKKKAAESNTIKKDEVKNKAELKIILPTEELLNEPVSNTKDIILINRVLQTSISTIKTLKSENEELSKQISFLTDKLDNLDKQNQKLNDKLSEITTLLKNNKNIKADPAKNTVSQTSGSKKLSQLSAADSKNSQLDIKTELAPVNQQESFIHNIFSSPAITIALVILTLIIIISILFTIRYFILKRKQEGNKTSFIDNRANKAVNITPTTPQQNKVPPKSKSKSKPIEDEDEDEDEDTEESFLSSLDSSSSQGTDISKEKEKEKEIEKDTETKTEKDEEDMDFFEYFEKKINTPEKSVQSNTLDETPGSESDNSADITLNLDINFDVISDDKNNKDDIDNEYHSSILGEIDTYLAYGNFNEAEKILNREISSAPANKNLHLKLFEYYSLINKRQEFIKHTEKIIELLKADMEFRNQVEEKFQETWNEKMGISF